MSDNNLIEIKDVSYAYGTRPILAGINMSIRRGSTVAIMGISGSGKTTLLRLMAGVMKAKQGEVWVGGQLVNDLDQAGIYQMPIRKSFWEISANALWAKMKFHLVLQKDKTPAG